MEETGSVFLGNKRMVRGSICASRRTDREFVRSFVCLFIGLFNLDVGNFTLVPRRNQPNSIKLAVI